MAGARKEAVTYTASARPEDKAMLRSNLSPESEPKAEREEASVN